MKRERCILFQWHVPSTHLEPCVGMFIEQLRYAGIVKVVAETTTDDGTHYMLELKAPKGVDALAWSTQNAARMRSFGINAQDAFREIS